MVTEAQADETSCSGERAPLLEAGSTNSNDSIVAEHRVPARIARRLFLSHFLSTWNSRVFEFGAVLYLATIFPGTLLVMSVYALVRGLSAIVFAPAVGQYIDRGNRLQVVRVSIGMDSRLTIPFLTAQLLIYTLLSLSETWRGGLLRRLLHPRSSSTPRPWRRHRHARASLFSGLR